jgi:hypothetical protein
MLSFSYYDVKDTWGYFCSLKLPSPTLKVKAVRHYLPETDALHIFILVDVDLQPKSIVADEEKDYESIEKDTTLNVKVYYRCWAARE